MVDIFDVAALVDTVASSFSGSVNKVVEDNERLSASAAINKAQYDFSVLFEQAQAHTLATGNTDEFVARLHDLQQEQLQLSVQSSGNVRVQQMVRPAIADLAQKNLLVARNWKVGNDQRRATEKYYQGKADNHAYARSSGASLVEIARRNAEIDAAFLAVVSPAASTVTTRLQQAALPSALIESYFTGLVQQGRLQEAKKAMATLLTPEVKAELKLDDDAVQRLAIFMEATEAAEMRKMDARAVSVGADGIDFYTSHGYESTASTSELLLLEARGSEEATRQLAAVAAMREYNAGVLISTTASIEDALSNPNTPDALRDALQQETSRRAEMMSGDIYTFAISRGVITEQDAASLASPDYQSSFTEVLNTQMELFNLIQATYEDPNAKFFTNRQVEKISEAWHIANRPARIEMAHALRAGVHNNISIYKGQLADIDPLLSMMVNLAPIAESQSSMHLLTKGIALQDAGATLDKKSMDNVTKTAVLMESALGGTVYNGWETENFAALKAVSLASTDDTVTGTNDLIKATYGSKITRIGGLFLINEIIAPIYQTLPPVGTDGSEFKRYMNMVHMGDIESSYRKSGGKGDIFISSLTDKRKVNISDIKDFGEYRWHGPNTYWIYLRTHDARQAQFLKDGKGNHATFTIDQDDIARVSRRVEILAERRASVISDAARASTPGIRLDAERQP